MDIELSSKRVEIYDMELQRYKHIERDFVRMNNDLSEYMGFSDEHLRSDKWLKRYNKQDLIGKIHEQRCVIRKLIDELEPSKKEEYINALKQIEASDEILK